MYDYPRFDIDADPPECTGQTSLFFPETPHSLNVHERHAKAICARCPYQTPCRDYASRRGESGIWGATTEGDRRGALAVDRDAAQTQRLSRYSLYEITQTMIGRDGLSVRECATRLGLSYAHVTATRRRVRREIDQGHWRPSTPDGGTS
ncbi:WhiB family transcriptional regulator [Actinomadura sp. NEAU-AAG7]|uniref:WhiB family transcriptional regulator n=1 Tax=Actinomadura sp. NEAU-AAG7 TaxID=2839640 RepID=UPI001BE4E157|nr:WhiB family transcriptional regulator [Actinomadura sp. NEAU-AAG7]